MKKILNNFEKVQGFLVVLFLIIMSVASFFQVINRNILKLSISWTEELSRYCMIWMTMIGTGISVRAGTQMGINIWGKKLKGIPRMIMDIFACLLVILFCTVTMISVIQLISTQLTSGQLSPALRVPMHFMTFSILIGMLFLIVVEIEQLVYIIKNKGIDPKEIEEEVKE